MRDANRMEGQIRAVTYSWEIEACASGISLSSFPSLPIHLKEGRGVGLSVCRIWRSSAVSRHSRAHESPVLISRLPQHHYVGEQLLTESILIIEKHCSG